MKKYFVLVGFLAAALGLAGFVEAQDPSFALSLGAPASLKGDADASLEYDAVAKLTTTNLAETDPGAQGWSLSVGIDGGGTMVAATTSAAVDALFSGGFNSTELTTGAGNEGAVSAVVLALKKAVTLPPTGPSVDILTLKIRVTVPQPVDVGGEPTCQPVNSRVFLVNGRVGSGQPVDNKITYKGETVIPTLGNPVVTEVCPKPPPCTTEPFNFGFSAENLGSGPDPVNPKPTVPPWQGIIGVDGVGGELPVETALGTVPETHVFANIISQIVLDPPGSDPTGKGISGWSMSVGLFGDGNLADVTYGGTIAERAGTGGFVLSEIVDMTKPANAATGATAGCVTACVLHLKKAVNLPLQGTESVLDMKVQGLGPQGDAETSAVVKLVEALTGSGEPVPNNLTVAGETAYGCNDTEAGVTVAFRKLSVRQFVRGNVNDDAKIDIADPIYLISAIFRSGPAAVCADAADANDDGLVDSSDAVYLISFQFGQPNPTVAPPAPFPDCGVDPTTEDALDCADTAALMCD